MNITIELTDDEQRALEFYVSKRKLGPINEYLGKKIRKLTQTAKVYEFTHESRRVTSPYLAASPEVKRIVDIALSPRAPSIQYGGDIKISTEAPPVSPVAAVTEIYESLVVERVFDPPISDGPAPISPRLLKIYAAGAEIQTPEIAEIGPEPIIIPMVKSSFFRRFLKYFNKKGSNNG